MAKSDHWDSELRDDPAPPLTGPFAINSVHRAWKNSPRPGPSVSFFCLTTGSSVQLTSQRVPRRNRCISQAQRPDRMAFNIFPAYMGVLSIVRGLPMTVKRFFFFQPREYPEVIFVMASYYTFSSRTQLWQQICKFQYNCLAIPLKYMYPFLFQPGACCAV